MQDLYSVSSWLCNWYEYKIAGKNHFYLLFIALVRWKNLTSIDNKCMMTLKKRISCKEYVPCKEHHSYFFYLLLG